MRHTCAEGARLVVLDIWIQTCVHCFQLRPRSTAFDRVFSEITFQVLKWNPNLLIVVLAKVWFWSGLFSHYWVIGLLLLYAWSFIMGFERGSESTAVLFDRIWLTLTSAHNRRTVCRIIASLTYNIIPFKTQLTLLSSLTINCMTLQHCEVKRLHNFFSRVGA